MILKKIPRIAEFFNFTSQTCTVCVCLQSFRQTKLLSAYNACGHPHQSANFAWQIYFHFAPTVQLHKLWNLPILCGKMLAKMGEGGYNFPMENLNQVIAKNLIKLRKANNFTQFELAQKLNYSDKSISKWENAEAIPSVEVLLQIGGLFGVGLDYFVSEDAPAPKPQQTKPKKNKVVVTLLSVLLVWLAAVVLFTGFSVIAGWNLWILFIWAIPASFVVTTVFACLWCKKRWMKYVSISMLLWTLLLALYLQFVHINIWLLFIIGAPLQICIVLWAFRDIKHSKI